MPFGSGWVEGEFAYPAAETRARLTKLGNVVVIEEDILALREPSRYGIGEVAVCHVDVDLYEPAAVALEFLSRCAWAEVFVRFDDWHGGEPEYDQHERLAFSEWVERYGYGYEVVYGGMAGGALVRRNR